MKEFDFADQLDAKPLTEALVLRHAYPDSSVAGGVITNVPHLVVQHSPTGFEFGYGGSGPADLALNVCQWYLKHTGYEGEKTECYDGECFSLAYALHQDLKNAFIALVPHPGVEIPFSMLDAWFKEHITEDLKRTYATIDREVEE